LGRWISSLEVLAQLCKAPRDAAGDRPGGQAEGLADRVVALVPREEPVKDVAAVLGQLRERLMHGERFVKTLERVVGCPGFGLFLELFARRSAQVVDAEPPCELREPGLNGCVVAACSGRRNPCTEIA